jgi:hypothetical protein
VAVGSGSGGRRFARSVEAQTQVSQVAKNPLANVRFDNEQANQVARTPVEFRLQATGQIERRPGFFTIAGFLQNGRAE